MIRLDCGTTWFELWIAPRGDGTADVMRRRGRKGEPRAASVVDALPLDGRSAQKVYDDVTRRLMHDGAFGRVVELPVEPREPALEAAMIDGRDRIDPASAIVYGDWLHARGHPRGELIAIDVALAADPANAALVAVRARVFHDHADVLIGDLVLWEPAPDRPRTGMTLSWECGFIAAARIDRVSNVLGAIHAVFQHPSARALRELVIGCQGSGAHDHARALEAILYDSPAPPLRRLYVADFDDSFDDGLDLSHVLLGDASELGEIFPSLEDGALKGRGDVVLRGLALRRCRRVALRTSTMTRDTLDAILTAPWPVLEELELWFGDPDRHYGAQIADPEPLGRLLSGTRFPALRVLRLMNAPFVSALIPALARSRLAAQIELLDLSMGIATDDDARALAMRHPAFPNLRTVRFVETGVTQTGRNRLRAAGFEVDDAPVCPARSPSPPGGRYTAIDE